MEIFRTFNVADLFPFYPIDDHSRLSSFEVEEIDAEQLALKYMEDLDRYKSKKKEHDRASSSTPMPDSENPRHARVKPSMPMPASGSPGREACPCLRSTSTPMSCQARSC
ncbi:hypothetical protein JCGZ_11221 [Jatropha curcas]|uniref:Uncharacterized protein n=1 Tax=Jatropha curcas TaxID=180498 RepID=A0A067KH72_JATCU|nr:hypothetical protein JCGZ_11221 [Jatropha curcas]